MKSGMRTLLVLSLVFSMMFLESIFTEITFGVAIPNGTAFNITINSGWNLISVPFALQNDSMHIVFEPKADKIISVWTYDGVTGQWYSYTPDGIENDDMNGMLPGWGYWVLATDSTKLSIEGGLFNQTETPLDKQIVKGWNMIGYWGTNNTYGNDTILSYDGPNGNGKPASCELYSLGDMSIELSSLWSYWEPYAPNQWIPFPSSKHMDPGAGYWLHTDQDDEYAMPTSCNI